MLTDYRAVRQVAKRIGAAVNRTVAALKEARVEHEPAMTDRMLGAIEETLADYRARGLRWTAKTLTDRGPGSQESRFGADFLVVAEFDLFDYKAAKGFLAQAKLLRDGKVNDFKDLQDQCEKMLALSPASFVFLYDETSVRVVPAISVAGSPLPPTDHYSRSATRFFEENLECFIGDREISAPTAATLDALAAKYESRRALLIKAENDPDSEILPLFAVHDQPVPLHERRLLPKPNDEDE